MNSVQRFACWAVATACLVTSMSSATAGSLLRGCAARDMQILMLIEEREGANAISGQRAIEALNSMMHARIVSRRICSRCADALR